MNTEDKGDVCAFVQTAEQIGGWVWVILLVDFDAREVRRSLVAEVPIPTERAAKDAGYARLEALAHDQ